MARLPQPGADEDIWGDVLNEYLSVSHTSGGALKSDAVNADAIQDGTIIPGKLSSSNSPSNGQVLGYNGTGFAWTAGGGGAVDSVNGQTGTVVLDPDDLDDSTTTNKFTTTAEISKLAGIEAGADVTDAANVDAAGATMNTDTNVSTNSWVLDEDDMLSNDATKVPTQQSVKAYVDANAGGSTEMTQAFSRSGDLAVATGAHRLYNDSADTWTITGVRASVGTAPTGTAIIIDVNINGTTIFTTQSNRPQIAILTNASSKVTNMDVTSVAPGDYLTIDIDQVGSTIAGANLTINVVVSA